MLTEIQAQEIIEMYESGKTQKEISLIFGCSQTNVSAILRKLSSA